MSVRVRFLLKADAAPREMIQLTLAEGDDSLDIDANELNEECRRIAAEQAHRFTFSDTRTGGEEGASLLPEQDIVMYLADAATILGGVAVVADRLLSRFGRRREKSVDQQEATTRFLGALMETMAAKNPVAQEVRQSGDGWEISARDETRTYRGRVSEDGRVIEASSRTRRPGRPKLQSRRLRGGRAPNP